MINLINPKDLLEFLKSRRSIRIFENKPIPEEEIKMILEAGRWSPSAFNRQTWEFVVIKNKDILEKISETAPWGKFIKRAPIAIAIIGKDKNKHKWYVQDTTLASMNMILMAWSLGIGTCWIGDMDRDLAKELLNVSKEDHLLTILPMGYLKTEIPRPTLRKKLDEIYRIV